MNKHTPDTLIRHSMRCLPRATGFNSAGQEGFSMLWALVVSLGVLLTAAAVSSRSFSGLFAAAFQQDARRARDAAEIGAQRVVSELNRERNRILLSRDPGNDQFWQASDVSGAVANNPCAALALPARTANPDLLAVGSGGVTATAERPVVFVADSGAASTTNVTTAPANSPSGQRYAYQLASARVSPDPVPTWASTGNPPARALITLTVRGYSYNAGRLASSATIEQRMEVVPKCCSLSLGANNNPQFGNDLRDCNSALTNPSNGFAFGVGLTDDGSAEINGTKGTIETIATGQPVSPLICVGSTGSSCPTSESIGGTNIPVVQVNTPLAPPEAYGEAAGTPLGAGASSPSSVTASALQPCSSSTNCPSNTAPASGASTDQFTRFVTEGSGGNATNVTIINVASMDLANLPSFCGTSTDSVTVARTVDSSGNPVDTKQTMTTIHCNVTRMDNANKEVFRVVTSDTRRLKLHFPNEGVMMSMNGNLEHCNNDTCSAGTTLTADPLLRFQIFGCEKSSTTGCVDPPGSTINSTNAANNQTLNLQGNSTAAAQPFFLYAPLGEITLNGGGGVATQWRGAMWVNNFTGNGNVEVQVPGAGVGELFNLFSSTGGGGGSGGGIPFIYEYVARAVRGLQLLPGL